MTKNDFLTTMKRFRLSEKQESKLFGLYKNMQWVDFQDICDTLEDAELLFNGHGLNKASQEQEGKPVWGIKLPDHLKGAQCHESAKDEPPGVWFETTSGYHVFVRDFRLYKFNPPLDESGRIMEKQNRCHIGRPYEDVKSSLGGDCQGGDCGKCDVGRCDAVKKSSMLVIERLIDAIGNQKMARILTAKAHEALGIKFKGIGFEPRKD